MYKTNAYNDSDNRSTGEPLRSNRHFSSYSSASGMKLKNSYTEKYRQRKSHFKSAGVHGLSKINISIGFEPINSKRRRKVPSKTNDDRTIKHFAKSIMNIIDEKERERKKMSNQNTQVKLDLSETKFRIESDISNKAQDSLFLQEKKTSNQFTQVTFELDASIIENEKSASPRKAKAPLLRQQVKLVTDTINSLENNLEGMMNDKVGDDNGKFENDYLKYAARECVFDHINKKFKRGCRYLESRVRKILYPSEGEVEIEKLERVVFQSIRFSRKLTRCFQVLSQHLNKFNDLDWAKLKEKKYIEDLKTEDHLEGVFIPNEAGEARSNVLAFELKNHNPVEEPRPIINNYYENRSLEIEGMGEVKGTFVPKIPLNSNEQEKPERRLKRSKFFDPSELFKNIEKMEYKEIDQIKKIEEEKPILIKDENPAQLENEDSTPLDENSTQLKDENSTQFKDENLTELKDENAMQTQIENKRLTPIEDNNSNQVEYEKTVQMENKEKESKYSIASKFEREILKLKKESAHKLFLQEFDEEAIPNLK